MNQSSTFSWTKWPKTFRMVFTFRRQPDRDTLVALGSYILVVGCLVAAFQIVTTAQVAANFILFGPVSLAALGIALPVFYTALIRKRTLADIGLTTNNLLLSIALSILFGLDTYRNTLGTIQVAWTKELVPLVSMALCVGLFEAVFFRGWLQLRFEEAFGLLPGIFLGAAAYAGYHVGYGMDLRDMAFLFWLGLMFAGVFRLTKNVLALWPFYTPIGGLFTNLQEGLSLPFEATYGFVLTIAVMGVLVAVGSRLNRPSRPPNPGL